ncbi:lysozyme-like domain-containing protein [Coprinopsis sp. MPI-PUGE-AT-0042]|nr:lysozyme-like domain-containing protein [Coprinopsis sp. MPI-PUGE-AT-0042]
MNGFSGFGSSSNPFGSNTNPFGSNTSPFSSFGDRNRLGFEGFSSRPAPDPFSLSRPMDFNFSTPSISRGPLGVNDATLNLIKGSEGFVPSPSPDPIGLPTVGYGHLCKQEACGEVSQPFPLTESTATDLLKSDLAPFQNCITQNVADSVNLTDNQNGALVSWAYNVGCGAAGSSTLIKRLNAGEDPSTVIEQELPKWNKAGGKVLPGLVTRRAREVEFSKGN